MNCVRWSMGDASLHGMGTSSVPGQCFGCYPCPWTKLLPMSPDRTPRGSNPENQQRPGVAPKDAWTCPSGAPIKGNFTTYSGERCIYHPPGGQFYGKTKPERCYATEDEARRDGCRASKR